MRVPPTTRALLHQLRGATLAYIEILEDVHALLDDSKAAGVRDQVLEALRNGGPMGTPGSIANAIEDALKEMPL